ncbi:YrdB family protein [Lacisediminihabitans changchengi]|uniref:YrdB family protein n=1 Tax=Lacisediminihabitans changchengi TaxID=2787634 RepID=A0A934SML3_9MICO|nr:YrdB family protein [Lacisediminihabitans changchengi]MBK4348298.1 YrdB family protein [Lacisediminihabitans changchengi]
MKLTPNLVLRFALELFALYSLGYWGYISWPFPLPGVYFMIGVPLFAAIIWGVFRSPKAVIPLDPVGRALVEIFVMGAAAFAWVSEGNWPIGLAFGAVATISGVINGRAEITHEREAD